MTIILDIVHHVDFLQSLHFWKHLSTAVREQRERIILGPCSTDVSSLALEPATICLATQEISNIFTIQKLNNTFTVACNWYLSRLTLGPMQPQGTRGSCCGCEANHSFPSNAKVQNGGAIPPGPLMIVLN